MDITIKEEFCIFVWNRLNMKKIINKFFEIIKDNTKIQRVITLLHMYYGSIWNINFYNFFNGKSEKGK